VGYLSADKKTATKLPQQSMISMITLPKQQR